MSTRWRIGLAAIVAAVVIGGFVPHGVLSTARSSVVEVAQMVEVPVSGPVTCLDATCGKGSPAPAAPTPGISLVAVVGGLVAVAAAAAGGRRGDGHQAPYDRDQADAGCGRGGCRAALPAGGIEAGHGSRDGHLRHLRHLGDRGAGRGQHAVRHGAADDDGSDDRRQTDPPPCGHVIQGRGAG